jgi:TetR/AcrR family transcriptional repressor of nem operon
MGRARDFDEDAALDAAVDAFWRLGWSGCSTRVLAHTMGLSTSSLYAAFGSKSALFERALERYGRRSGLGTPSPEAARSYVRAVVAPREPRGCLLVVSAADADGLPPEAKRVVLGGLSALERWLVRALGDETRGRTLLDVVLGLQVRHRIGEPPERLRTDAERWIAALIP